MKHEVGRDDEVMSRLGDSAIEEFFVYTKSTDRTRYVLSVVARVGYENEDDCIDRANLVFTKDFSYDFAVGVAFEIEKFVKDLDTRPKREGHLRLHLNASNALLQKLKDKIIH